MSRILVRYRVAMEHPSEEARKEYLKEHPKADPSNHTVAPGKEKALAKDDEEAESDEKEPEAKTPGKGKSFFKSLSETAKAFLSHSSTAVQKFVADEEHRTRLM